MLCYLRKKRWECDWRSDKRLRAESAAHFLFCALRQCDQLQDPTKIVNHFYWLLYSNKDVFFNIFRRIWLTQNTHCQWPDA